MTQFVLVVPECLHVRPRVFLDEAPGGEVHLMAQALPMAELVELVVCLRDVVGHGMPLEHRRLVLQRDDPRPILVVEGVRDPLQSLHAFPVLWCCVLVPCARDQVLPYICKPVHIKDM